MTVSRFPERVSRGLAFALGLCAYAVERRLRPESVHAELPRRVGFAPLAVDARTCESPEELAALVLASSATPPITPVGRFRDGAYLDGGFVDNAPASLAEAHPGVARNLVLLTRHFPRLAAHAGGARTYVAPSEPVPVKKWDYARQDLSRRPSSSASATRVPTSARSRASSATRAPSRATPRRREAVPARAVATAAIADVREPLLRAKGRRGR